MSGLPVLLPEVQRLGEIGGLETDMGHPGFGVIVIPNAVVDASEFPIGVGVADRLEEMVPIAVVVALHQIELVGHRPPGIPIRRQSRATT